jgi:hypothetical protein
MATDNADKGESASTAAKGDALSLNDMLSGVPVEGGDAVGVYLTFHAVEGSTVISVDTDGSGPAAPIPILTLANVTGKTLQDLLSDVPLQC